MSLYEHLHNTTIVLAAPQKPAQVPGGFPPPHQQPNGQYQNGGLNGNSSHLAQSVNNMSIGARSTPSAQPPSELLFFR